MNSKYLLAGGSIIAVLLLGVALWAQDPYVDEFGITEGKQVDRGFVFMDGKYTESPYVIARKGLKLYVNGQEIKRPSRHMETKPLTGDVDPARLSEEARQKLFRALEGTRGIYEKYLSRGYGYLFSSSGGHVKLSPYTVAYDLPDVVRLLSSNKSKSDKLAELRPHNWHLLINIEPLVDKFSPSAQLSTRLRQQADELLRVDDFGSETGPPVAKGFVFYDGQYLDAPYVVQRKGLAVFLSNKMIIRPLRWPVTVFPGDIDPTMPVEINSETSIFDEVVSEYLHQKHAYLRKHKTQDEERRIMEEVFRSLPFIVEARIDKEKSHILHVTTTEGVSFAQSLISMRGRQVKWDKESVRERVEKQHQHFNNALHKGACYFFSRKGGRTRLSTNSVRNKLPLLIEMLRSGKPEDQIKQEIRQLGINLGNERLVELLNNFSASPQLEAQLNDLKKPKEDKL